MQDLRFGVLTLQDAPFHEQVRRWQRVEELGFDQLFVADHTADYRDLGGTWFDGWTTLTLMARETSIIRIGTLVTNPVIRPPAICAKAAASIDHLSGGRLELGIGTGIAGFDHAAAGLPYWDPRERGARFAEYVTVVDGLLRSSASLFTFHGDHYATHETSFQPAPVQQPRPPIIVGGQSPTVRRVAVEVADAWNTHGPFGASPEEIFEVTRRQNAELDEACERAGRRPDDVRRSLLLFDTLDPWAAPGAFEDVVTRFLGPGIREFVVFWPDDDGQTKLFEEAATEVVPALRRG